MFAPTVADRKFFLSVSAELSLPHHRMERAAAGFDERYDTRRGAGALQSICTPDAPDGQREKRCVYESAHGLSSFPLQVMIATPTGDDRLSPLHASAEATPAKGK